MKIRTVADVGLVLRERRRELGLTQAELAERIGASRQWIIRVEQGNQRSDVGLVLKAIAALRLTLDVRGDGDTAPPERKTGRVDIDAVVRAARRGSL
jgi:HTH-type transcriptional regulator/antitoxin HipB